MILYVQYLVLNILRKDDSDDRRRVLYRALLIRFDQKVLQNDLTKFRMASFAFTFPCSTCFYDIIQLENHMKASLFPHTIMLINVPLSQSHVL
jgi:hypothetical protein